MCECKSSTYTFYKFFLRVQSCTDMRWFDKTIQNVYLNIKWRKKEWWWSGDDGVLQKFDSFSNYLLHCFIGFPISLRSTCRHRDKNPADSSHPLPFRAVLRSRPSETAESRRGKQQKELYQDRNMSPGESQERLSRGQGLLVKPALTAWNKIWTGPLDPWTGLLDPWTIFWTIFLPFLDHFLDQLFLDYFFTIFGPFFGSTFFGLFYRGGPCIQGGVECSLSKGVKLRLIQAPMRQNFSLWRPNPEN